MTAKVIGIAAPAGGGKSTIVQALAATLDHAPTVLFDSYEVEMPADWPGWLAGGADFNEWRSPELIRALDEATSDSAELIFEAPLGRAHSASGRYIDTLVFVEVPLEVALARFVARELAAGEERLPFLQGYIQAYEPLLRLIYLEQRRQVMAGADLVVDGLQPVGAVVDQILRYLLSS